MKFEFKPLSEVAAVFVGMPTRTERVPTGQAGHLILTVRALTDHGIDAGGSVRINLDHHPAASYCVRDGDILIPARSTSFKVAVVPGNLDGTPINATLIGLRCGPELDPRILAAYLRHPEGRAAIGERAQSGTAQMNITVKALSQLPVPIPPIEQQRSLVDMLQAADEAFASAIDAAHRRRELVMNVMFTRMTGATRP